MALKADRQIDATEIGYFFNGVSERGVILSLVTGGSGIALDNSKNLVSVAGNGSGSNPIGLLLNDFVQIDRTRLPLNWYKDQQASGDKATLLRRGWVVTNMIQGTVTAGMQATLGPNGVVSGIAYGSLTNKVNTPIVGQFLSGKDEAGFARLEINLPL